MALNAREGEQDANLEYWLRLIESFGGDSPVIAVTNQIKQHQLDLIDAVRKRSFPSSVTSSKRTVKPTLV